MHKGSQIIAMGGGGFSMEPDNLRLDRYILAAAAKPGPKVCFLPTASGDAESYIQRFYASFASLVCVPTHLSLFKPAVTNLREFVLSQDVIYVGGGSTRNLLTLWREWGLSRILEEAWHSGVVLAGLSAGSLCWFEEGLSDSVCAGDLQPIRGLGFIQGSNCPHYDGESYRRPAYHRLLGERKLSAGYGVDDGAALHFLGSTLARVVASRPQAKAYKAEWNGSIVEEQALETQFLT